MDFLKISKFFFLHELPGGFCNRAVFQFLVNLICGVSVLDMLRGVSIVEFRIDCACLGHSLSSNARHGVFFHTFHGCSLGKACSVLHAGWVISAKNS